MTEPAPGRPTRLLERESQIVRVLAEAGTVGEAAHDVLAALAGWLQWDVALLWVPDEELRLLRCGPSWSADDGTLLEFRRLCDRLTFARGVGLLGRAWSTAEPSWVEDVQADEHFPRAGIAAEAGLRSATAIPVVAPNGVLGVIELLSRAVRVQEPEDEQLLVAVGRQLAHYVGRVRAEERLRHSGERTAAILEAALDCIVTMDDRGCVVDFNSAAAETFGYSRDDAVGRPLVDLIVPPELRAAHLAGLERYLATGESRVLNQRLELEAMRSDGSTLPVELTVTRAGLREPPLFAGFIRDITTRRQAESDRRELLKEAIAARASEEAARVRLELAQGEAEIERRRLEFLAQIGLTMASSMDYAATLEEVARAAIPDIADLCAVTVIAPDGRPRSLAVAHAVPEREALLRELTLRAGPKASLPGMAKAMRTGEYALIEEVTDHALVAAAGDEEALRLLRGVGLRSTLSVPMKAAGRVLGTITLGFGGSGRSFGPADIVVATALAARAGLHIENARLYTERSRIAHTLQQSLLPSELPSIPGLEVAAYYRAAGDQNEVGGDFYDVFQSEEGVWTVIIGDVSGKGAEAAAQTALTRHTLYAAAVRETSPARNLGFLDEAMRKRMRGAGSFSTVLYVRVCPGDDSTALTLASGGHPPALILRADGSIERLETPGTLVGVLENARFEDRGAHLGPGELLLLYTDGAIELRRRDIFFGERELERVLLEQAGVTAAHVVDAVARRIDELQDGSPRDDIALLALRMAPVPHA
jgi:PAS domain S-box-containing protein